MGSSNQFGRRNIDKRFLSKNKTIKLYKEKQGKINLFKKEVADLIQRYDQVDSQNVETFNDFPLSGRTKRALKTCGYLNPTEIQKESIILSLQGRDILGAAKTGSGKTLAFVIPVLECLYVSGWSILDGLGALIITPTRELAYQIYEVINKVGTNHQFSVGLIIGGKDLAMERKLLDKCNIMICTPGRLLQHMDENPLFDSMNLKLLILDEADRILDLGFEKAMNAILENLPQERQTLLFSATQTKSVKDLARLSLKNPVYVSVDEHATHTTPETLQQSYIICEAHDKMNLLWSFIKSHKKQKILVFMSSCKQVKFTYESVCRLRPGVSIMALYGSLHQLRRMQIYDEFCTKNHAVMFATDIASRGLDFPNVNWVVQLDCPEDVNTYIHRAGRTARYQKGGEALLVLLPSEKPMIEQLTKRKIPIEMIQANPNKLYSVQRKLEAILLRDKVLKESGIRGFKAYLKNIFLMKDKSIFDVTKVDTNLYANSLGLDYVPRIRFLEKHVTGYKDTATKEMSNTDAEQLDDDESENEINTSNMTEDDTVKYPRNDPLFKNTLLNCDSSDESADDLLEPKEQDVLSDIEEESEDQSKNKKILTKAALVKRALKKKTKVNTIVKFDEDGKPLREVGGKLVPDATADFKRELLEEGYSIEKSRLLLQKENELDKELYREKIKTRHRTERLKEKEKRWLKNPSSAPPSLRDPEGASDHGDESSGNDVDPNNMSLSESDADDDESQSEAELESRQSFHESDGECRNEAEENTFVQAKQESNPPEDNEQSEDENNSSEELYQSRENVGSKRKKSVGSAKRKKQHIIGDNSTEKKAKRRTIEDDEQLALHFLSNI